MIIDEVMEENEMQNDYDEKKEDLNNIPLFASSEEMVEPPSLVESSLTLPERDSAPQAVSTSLLNSDIRPEDLRGRRYQRILSEWVWMRGRVS